MEETKTITKEEVENRFKYKVFLTIKEVVALTGWSIRTVQDLFNIPDFPSCDYGKEKIVEKNAFLKFFDTPRRRY